MQGYGVHLLFHALALLIGASVGVAAGLWWNGQGNTMVSLGAAALVLGVVVLTVQAFIGRDPAPRRRNRAAPRPVPARQPTGHAGSGARMTAAGSAASQYRSSPHAHRRPGTLPSIDPVTGERTAAPPPSGQPAETGQRPPRAERSRPDATRVEARPAGTRVFPETH